MDGYNRGERCEFMQYHAPHDYRTRSGNPRRCDGLRPPAEPNGVPLRDEVTEQVTQLQRSVLVLSEQVRRFRSCSCGPAA